MAAVKFIITDLDRTLLRDDKTISEYTINVFEKCRQKNIKIAFATARPKRSIADYIESVKPDAVIYMNGAVVTAGGLVLRKHLIPSHTAKQILKQIEKKFPESTLSFEMDDVIYPNFDFMEKTEIIKKINFDDLPDQDAEKIIIGTISADKILEFKNYIPPDLYLIIDTGRFGFILNKNASKWEGIKTIAAYFGIDTNETVAFGDDLTDLEMLENCGIGVAVDNAADEVKSRADFICGSNNNDGVAKWIEGFKSFTPR
ncbi:MAG: HAD family hydrolase [Treponema sp.]|nr:HAD family hydrolase [Treponema sp.]